MDAASADRHDTWNLLSLGALNAAHIVWWSGCWPAALLPGAIPLLFTADCCYLLADFSYLLLAPACVSPSVRPTLLLHHAIVVSCMPFAWGKPVLMAHLLRTWMVELHSFVHIAARKTQWPNLQALLARVNKPIFVGLRLIGFPLSWFAYARDRAALSVAMRAAHAPGFVHVPLSIAHFAMYGLMLKWGHALLFSRRNTSSGQGGSSQA
ncbi:MAG: hypothetical protein SGPRY_014258 [Prymnesium sp.]